jgi:hypothetical protein
VIFSQKCRSRARIWLKLGHEAPSGPQKWAEMERQISLRQAARQQKKDARAIDPAPVVEMEEDAVVVEVVVFSMWGGFSQETYAISRSFPHTILDSDHEVLVEYDCGIIF